MKRLTILRHAKSSWDDPDLDDFDRPLNDRGRKAAQRMGRELRERGFHFDLVLASPAARVRDTLDNLQKAFELAGPIRFEPSVYLAPPELLLQLVWGLPETTERPLLVGHNPGLQQLVLDLVGENGPARARVRDNLPTAAVAAIELPADRWKDAAPHSGALVDLILPKELD